MFDRYNRKIDYLRVSVTDRCNLRCRYCMPENGIQLIRHEDILSYEEIHEVVETAVRMGFRKVRITGGEPLVRKGITHLVAMISSIAGIEDLAMTTNGILLDKFAGLLARAGLHRVNVSLDTLDPGRYREITRLGNLGDALKGINAARDAGLNPVKINCVIRESLNEPDARAVEAFGREQGLQVRFIRQMDLKTGIFYRVVGGEGGNCPSCNRLRLTADGKIKPCLFNDMEWSVREFGAEEAIRLAVLNKPRCGTTSRTGAFSRIGG